MALRDWIAKKIASKPKEEKLEQETPVQQEAPVAPKSIPPVKETIRTPDEEKELDADTAMYQNLLTEEYKKQTSSPGKPLRQSLTDQEKRVIEQRARYMAENKLVDVETQAKAASQTFSAGIPATEWVWHKEYDEKLKKEIGHWVERPIPPYERVERAAQHRVNVEALGGKEEEVKRLRASATRLGPTISGIEEEQTKGTLEDVQRQRQLSPMYSKLEKGNLEAALYQQKQQEFGRTKRGRVLKAAGKVAEAGASGLGHASAGMGMAILAQPRTGTQYITGQYDPRMMQMYTPRPLPVGGRLAGSGMNPGMSPAGMALIPNLKNLNPAIMVNPIRPGQKQQVRQSLSPLPRRRQQQQPGATRIG